MKAFTTHAARPTPKGGVILGMVLVTLLGLPGQKGHSQTAYQLALEMRERAEQLREQQQRAADQLREQQQREEQERENEQVREQQEAQAEAQRQPQYREPRQPPQQDSPGASYSPRAENYVPRSYVPGATPPSPVRVYTPHSAAASSFAGDGSGLATTYKSANGATVHTPQADSTGTEGSTSVGSTAVNGRTVYTPHALVATSRDNVASARATSSNSSTVSDATTDTASTHSASLNTVSSATSSPAAPAKASNSAGIPASVSPFKQAFSKSKTQISNSPSSGCSGYVNPGDGLGISAGQATTGAVQRAACSGNSGGGTSAYPISTAANFSKANVANPGAPATNAGGACYWSSQWDGLNQNIQARLRTPQIVDSVIAAYGGPAQLISYAQNSGNLESEFSSLAGQDPLGNYADFQQMAKGFIDVAECRLGQTSTPAMSLAANNVINSNTSAPSTAPIDLFLEGFQQIVIAGDKWELTKGVKDITEPFNQLSDALTRAGAAASGQTAICPIDSVNGLYEYVSKQKDYLQQLSQQPERYWLDASGVNAFNRSTIPSAQAYLDGWSTRLSRVQQLIQQMTPVVEASQAVLANPGVVGLLEYKGYMTDVMGCADALGQVNGTLSAASGAIERIQGQVSAAQTVVY